MRDSAGCSRFCIASNSSFPPSSMTISPSSAECGGRRPPSVRSSGKYRSSGRSFRLQSASSPPSFSRTPRKPSHFGSYCQRSPSGSFSTSCASIGGNGTFGPGIRSVRDFRRRARNVGEPSRHLARRPKMHELALAPALRDEVEKIGAHRVHAAKGAQEKERRRCGALSGPCPPLDERDDLSFRRPPEMSAERKIDVDDRVRPTHPPVDHWPRPEPVDDPRIVGRPAFQNGCDLVERRTPPTGKPLHLVNLVHRNAEMFAEHARQGGLPATAVSDERDASHETIVTRKRERGPPPSRGRRTSLE